MVRERMLIYRVIPCEKTMNKSLRLQSASREGFTLIELMVVLTLSVLVVGIVAVQMKSPYQAAKFEDCLERIEFNEQLIRSHAQRFERRSVLVVDFDENTIYARKQEQSDGPCFRVDLPRGVKLISIITTAEEISHGRVQVDVSTRGQTPSYALCLREGKNNEQWLLFAGTTGQVTRMDNSKDVHEIFTMLK